jgi:hypothetical protein
MKILIKEGIVKKMVNRVLGYDLSDHIEMITNWEELDESFKNVGLTKGGFNWYLNNYGPMFCFNIADVKFLAQNRQGEWTIYSDDDDYSLNTSEDELLELIGIGFMGVTLQQVIDEFIEE